MFIDYRQSRAEAQAKAQKNHERCQERLASLSARGEGVGHFLYERTLERLEEYRQELLAIQAISEEEWQRLHDEAIRSSKAFVARMNQGNDALWNNPHTTKEEVVRFLTGEE